MSWIAPDEFDEPVIVRVKAPVVSMQNLTWEEIQLLKRADAWKKATGRKLKPIKRRRSAWEREMSERNNKP